VTAPPFRMELLSSSNDRNSFRCGNARVNKYFRETVSQDIKHRYVKCLVAVEIATGQLAGFYTLTSNGVPFTDIPDDLKKKLRRYPTVPVALIGWLGRHLDFKGQGLGDVLLFDAFKRIATSEVASHAIIVDAIDDDAMKFYRSYGFVSLSLDAPRRMYIPVETALKAIEATP
jgi:ribosomal protein S18 acetylase RimI-like enzyme